MSEAVRVIVRCRPLNNRETNLNCQVVVNINEDRGICTLKKPGQSASTEPKQFTFDGAYYMQSTTEQIYNDIAYPLVEGVVEGYNGTVFAYGQTGCGKSFTMQGIESPQNQRGVIPRAFQHIFESVSIAENTKYLVHASYLEIYNEEVRDLLSKNIKDKLEVKQNPDRGIYVKGLLKKAVGNVQDCEKIMAQGWKNRSTGATLMNADSSRSHSIFTIYLEACDTGIDGGDHIRAGKLNLVDLAGSERQGKTGATGERLREATKINLSLSALGNVISALVDGKSKHIPYRDSKLTRLLQDSLGGNTKTLMVACLSPADNNYEETLSTLRYANRAKNIKNKPTINEDPKDALLREYQEEIKKLRALLAGQLGADGIKGSPYASDALLAGQSPSQIKLRSQMKEEATLHVGVKSQSTTLNTDGIKKAEMLAQSMKREKEEAVKLKMEYENKLNTIKEQYEKEQSSNIKLQQDIEQLKTQYEQHLKQEGLATQKTLTMERITQESIMPDVKDLETEKGPREIGDVFVEGLKKVVEDNKPEIRQTEKNTVDDQKIKEADLKKTKDVPENEIENLKSSSRKISEDVLKHDETAAKSSVSTPYDDISKEDIVRQHEEALKRLQQLQMNMVGGENVSDEEVKRRRKKREEHLEGRRAKRMELNDDDDVIMGVYEDMSEQVKVKDKLFQKQKKKNEALTMEIEDLNYEFERDRSEYLTTIRKQERELNLLNEILNKIQPTVRRDCNYSNMDKIKSEASFDEDLNKWNLPELLLIRTKLPNTSEKGFISQKAATISRSSEKMSDLSGLRSDHLRGDTLAEDKYLLKLRGREASNYFQPKRQLGHILASSAHSDPGRGTNTTSRFYPTPPPAQQQHHLMANPDNCRYLHDNHENDVLSRRPHKLEALNMTSQKRKKKSSKHNLNSAGWP